MMQTGEDATTLGRSVNFRGELSGSGSLVIEGQVDGVVRVPGARVIVGKEARVRGAIQAQDIVVHGLVEGEVFATGSIELRDGATFHGDLFVARLSIEDFAVVKANVDPSRANGEPAPYKAGSAAAPAEAMTLAPRPTGQTRPGLVAAQRSLGGSGGGS